MQMFGVGVLELLVIMLLTVIVVGPDKMPALAADLARWIRQGRAYARHVMGDFNEVVSELQKEAGASQEDWKEIASVVSRNTGEIGKELQRASRDAEEAAEGAARDAEEAGDLADAKSTEPAAARSNGARSSRRNGAAAAKTDAAMASANGAGLEEPASGDESEGEPAEEKPWYVPETPTRRRSSRRRTRE